jgi:hypothetical protein
VIGIIFNLLEEVITEEFGDDTWDQWLQSSQIDGGFTSLVATIRMPISAN